MRVSRALSVLVAIGYIVIASQGGGPLVFQCILFLIFPMALIWFSDEFGGYLGFMRGHAITAETPGCLVAVGGWLLLLLPVIMWLLRRHGGV